MRIALYEPDIPQNTGTILRTCACLGAEAHIIEPAGFPVTDRAFRRAGLDYLDQVTITRHASFAAFDAWRREERLSRRDLVSRPYFR
jgi:tRNA (cytidine/uridine-2'-O-)-methyltransferase